MMTGRKNESVSEGETMIEELSLGQALAVLKAEDETSDLGNPLPFYAPSNEEFLSGLRARREWLKTEPRRVKTLYKTVPKPGCKEEFSFLADNPEFFLAYITLTPHAAKKSLGEVSRLFEHMNNCFICFEEFSLVLRDYYLMVQELGGNGAKKTIN
jgi:hypothetical protein